MHFKLMDATQEKDNNKTDSKKERKFMLSEEEPVRQENDELFIQFVYLPDKEKQDKHNKGTLEKLIGDLNKKLKGFQELFASAKKDTNITILEKHINSYTARSSFDFFIHKDLGGFLQRELDFYIKNEVIYLDDLDGQDEQKLKSEVAKSKVIKHLGTKIILFLKQLEEIQKKMWLKKKFIIESGYCITLDRIPEKLYAEIINNEAQKEEWQKLFLINEIIGDLTKAGFTKKLSIEFLKENKYLVLDTKFFGNEFKNKLLQEIDKIDERCDGLIINSENFQALNTILSKYKEKVQCVYIDPPYNTGDSKIIYKNDFDSSAWLSLMQNRISKSLPFLDDDFTYFIAIDDYEMVPLCQMIDTQFDFRREMIIVNHHPQGGKAITIANTHEYMLALVNSGSDRKLVGRSISEDVEERPYKRSGTAVSNFRIGRPNSFYAILVDEKTKKVVGLEKPFDKDAKYPTSNTKEGFRRVYPIGNNGSERVWRNYYETAKRLFELGKLKCSDNFTIYQLIEHGEKKTALFSNWVDTKYNAGTFGANLLNNILGSENKFSYPKSIFTVEDAIYTYQDSNEFSVLDFFGGSGDLPQKIVPLSNVSLYMNQSLRNTPAI